MDDAQELSAGVASNATFIIVVLVTVCLVLLGALGVSCNNAVKSRRL